MNNEDKILQALEALQRGQEAMQGDIAAMREQQAAHTAQISAVVEQQAIHTAQISAMVEQQATHTQAIMNLENNVMHELKMLNELLPDALAKREAFEGVAAKVEDHDNRIYALEQKAANG